MFKYYLRDLNWFYCCKKKRPNIFCYFYEKDIKKINSIFCDFLQLELTDTLCNEFLITDNRVVNILPKYKLDINDLIKNKRIEIELLNELISNDASIAEINNLKL